MTAIISNENSILPGFGLGAQVATADDETDESTGESPPHWIPLIPKNS